MKSPDPAGVFLFAGIVLLAPDGVFLSARTVSDVCIDRSDL